MEETLMYAGNRNELIGRARRPCTQDPGLPCVTAQGAMPPLPP